MGLNTMQLADGRTLEYCLTGPADTEQLLVFHLGTPAGAIDFPPVTEAAAAHGIRTVTYSRPGYAYSTRKPGYVMANAADDTASLADHLGAAAFFVAGWSGGGAPALACAALLPERVRACVIVAGFVPPQEIADDWPEWYPVAYREEYLRLLVSHPDDLVPEYERSAKELSLTTAAFDGWDFPPVDIEAIGRYPVAAEAVAGSIRRSVSTGNWERIDESLAWAHPWGVDPRIIRVPVTIRHGTADKNVVIEDGRWLAAHIPEARSQILEGHGHMSVAMPFEPVVEALLETGH